VLTLLASYVAGAILMPYVPFLATALEARYDIDRLGARFDTSFEQVCHRLVTLRRPGAQGIRFGFMRADAAGHISKRFALPRLPMPVYGNACPLWAMYLAFQAPGTLVRQLVEFPGGDRYLMLARAVEKNREVWGRPRHLKSVMLMCEALVADRMVYGDDIDLSPNPAVWVPVGQTCRVCVRTDCTARQEDAILAPTVTEAVAGR
jgi:predicted transcriptional regulator